MRDLKTLSIAIPVFNGKNQLNRTLASIQIALELLPENLKSDVEILVSDNCSVDGTWELLQTFHFCSQAVLSRNASNLGYDKNLDALVGMSSAKYTWFVGCGEILLPQSILNAFDLLKCFPEVSNIVLGCHVYNEKDHSYISRRLGAFKTKIVSSMARHRYSLCITGNIVNTKMWKSVSTLPLHVNGWAHVERILQIISSDRRLPTIFSEESSYVLFRDKNGWYAQQDSYVPHVEHIVALRSSCLYGYSRAAAFYLDFNSSHASLRTALLQSIRAGHKFSSEEIVRLRNLFRTNITYWLFCDPVIQYQSRNVWSFAYFLASCRPFAVIYLQAVRLIDRAISIVMLKLS